MRDVLLVEDEQVILYSNKFLLERRGGYTVRTAECLADAKKEVEKKMPDIIVLDIMLPDGSGLDLLKELRQKSNVPVLLLTALSESRDELSGLESGGDDYITKPYDNSVLLARIDMILRRSSKIPDTLSLGKMVLDTASKTAHVGSKDMFLKTKEYSLLELFVQNPNKIMNAEFIYTKIWGQPLLGNDRTLRTTMSNLRTCLAEHKAGYTVTSKRGEGYYLHEKNEG